MLGNVPSWTSDVGASCTTWSVWAEAYQFTTRWDSSAPTRRMMLLMVAGVAVITLASFSVAAAIAIRAHTVIRRLIFKDASRVGRKCVGISVAALRRRSSVRRVNLMQWTDDVGVKLTDCADWLRTCYR